MKVSPRKKLTILTDEDLSQFHCELPTPWVFYSGTELLYSDIDFAVFRDHKPAASHHYLVVPNRHYEKIPGLTRADIPMIRRMEEIGKEVLVERAGPPGTRSLSFSI